ncbi:hypothetical protein K9N68_18180 [Kovacikia minuta CCNUW1]|uniref:hypothetical protein n=1 Tax=Kovacikia minuta TaxID=2931930 RepID=UPI001CCC1A73|nr:hypothetical protein [Kovacikia minuta]UBF23701.1 hypothetical protein K9N68_18180 [Kovacikia minuta CCNUW1]
MLDQILPGFYLAVYFLGLLIEQAAIVGLNALNAANLQKASHLAIANLYSYFQVEDESQEDQEDAMLVNA